MKLLLPPLLSFALSLMSSAQTCREVVRDASGRIMGSSTGSGKCEGGVKTPVLPAGVER